MMFKKLGILTILVVLALMASVPAVSAQGQALVTGSVILANGYQVNFNVRGTGGYGASGFLILRADGQKNVFSIDSMIPDGYGWWNDLGWRCNYFSGLATEGVYADGNHRLCVIVCDDGPPGPGGTYIPVAILHLEEFVDPDDQIVANLSGIPIISGNVVIKD